MSTPSELELPNDLVHVWRAGLDVDAARSRGSDRSLSAQERARAARFRFTRDRDRFVAARCALRAILARYLDTQPGQLSFRQGSHGKPYLAEHGDLRFSVSHAGATMLVAVAHRREVGIDIEDVATGCLRRWLAPAALSPPEQRFLNALDRKARQTAFLRLWTRKEAYLKADGVGMSLPVTSVDVSAPGGVVGLLDESTGAWRLSTRWMLQTPAVGSELTAALAAEGRHWRFACFQWTG